MYASVSSSRDMNILFPAIFNHSEGELHQKNRETMAASDIHQQQQQQHQVSSGLMRFRSTPSSMLENFVDGSSEGEKEGCDDFLQPRSSSPEAESMFARFMSCGGGGGAVAGSPSPDPATATGPINQRNSQFIASMKHEAAEVVPQQSGYSAAGAQMLYQAPPPAPLHPQSSLSMDNSYGMVNPSVMHHSPPEIKTSSTNCSNLIRHSSSPAGFLSHLENGYGSLRRMRNLRAGNGTNGEAAPGASRLKVQVSFPSGSPPSGLMSQISEIGNESIGADSLDDESLGDSSGGNRCYIPSFPIGAWESALVSENFSGLKRARGVDGKVLSGLNSSEIQNGDMGNRPPGLTHHFSLPKTSAEMAAIDQFLQIQESVPCKIRAKRGCATHPRSIAERVRRTRISERMRKLQELVPNMDKQTNTADMLDLAVEYIKDLQKQAKNLKDSQANCTCSSKQKPCSSPVV